MRDDAHAPIRAERAFQARRGTLDVLERSTHVALVNDGVARPVAVRRRGARLRLERRRSRRRRVLRARVRTRPDLGTFIFPGRGRAQTTQRATHGVHVGAGGCPIAALRLDRAHRRGRSRRCPRRADIRRRRRGYRRRVRRFARPADAHRDDESLGGGLRRRGAPRRRGPVARESATGRDGRGGRRGGGGGRRELVRPRFEGARWGVGDGGGGAVGVGEGEEEARHGDELGEPFGIGELEDDRCARVGAVAGREEAVCAKARVVVDVELAHVEPVVRGVVSALAGLGVGVRGDQRQRAGDRGGLEIRERARGAGARDAFAGEGTREVVRISGRPAKTEADVESGERPRGVRRERERDTSRQRSPTTNPGHPRTRRRGFRAHRPQARARRVVIGETSVIGRKCDPEKLSRRFQTHRRRVPVTLGRWPRLDTSRAPRTVTRRRGPSGAFTRSGEHVVRVFSGRLARRPLASFEKGTGNVSRVDEGADRRRP